MSEISLAGLRIVREVARLGSFSAAADRLGYTQSAVSRQVALVERAAGRELFERHARGVRLTAAGGIVVRRAETVLAELDATRQELADLGVRASGRLRVGAFSTALAALVPRAIAVCAVRDPQLAVVLREGLSAGLLAAVAGRRLDLAVVTPPGTAAGKGVQLSTLLEDPLLVAVARDHPLARQASVTTDRLVHEPWIAGSADPGSTLLGAWAGRDRRAHIAYVAKE
ncbi:MAG TPA: LysR family transcriptional regulator, partial [Solirubrobacteraceae bacterium]